MEVSRTGNQPCIANKRTKLDVGSGCQKSMPRPPPIQKSQVYDDATKLRTDVGNRGAPEAQGKFMYKANATRTKQLQVSGAGNQPSIRKPQVCDDDASKLRTEVGNGASLPDPAPWNSVDDKSLRAALLTERFADTIFKAKHQIKKSDFKTIQRDKERLEMKKRRQEQARMDAARKRERDRATARMAMEAMKKTVEIDDAMDIMRDFDEIICQGQGSCAKFNYRE